MEDKKIRFKSLKKRSIKMIILAFLCMACMTYLILNVVMMRGIEVVEESYIEEHMNRVQNTIDSELSNLYALTYDWAVWDDTYQFVDDHNENFIESNLTPETFCNLQINVMAFINESGEYVYVGYINHDNKQMEEVPKAFLTDISQSSISENADEEYSIKGIINLPEGPMLIASCPILTSDGEGPVKGNLVMGYYLDQTEVAALASQLDLDLEIEALNMSEERSVNVVSNTNVVQELSQDKIECISYRNDIYGNLAVKLDIVMNRDISGIGRSAIYRVLLLILLMGFIATISVLAFFDKNIISRISALCKGIEEIGRQRLFSSRLQPQKYNDELNVVSTEINYMIGELEKAQFKVLESEEALRRNNEDLEKRVEERTKDLNSSNEKLQSEIKMREEIEEQMKYLAYHDYLTDLPNNLLMKESINHAVNLANRLGNKVAVMFIDLDGFKLVNDSAGHAAGDLLLKEVAHRLVKILRKSDIVGRNGGDEFLFLAEDLKQYTDATVIAKKILDSFKEAFVINGKEYFLTASIGIAYCPEDGQNAETLIKHADLAMYNAKENGRNQYALCSTVLKDNILKKVEMTSKLHRALEKGELELYYQPQIAIKDESMVGVEALLRWHHPELGLVSPSEFIPIAENTGLIISIGEWVLRTACKQNKVWQDEGYPFIRMAVNLSIKQFQKNDLVEQVGTILKETGLRPEWLELEITESLMMDEESYIVEKLNQLKKMGIQIAIDDFGTEYSSLSYLKKLPIDRLKIATPFVQGITKNMKDESIIKAVLVLAKSMGMRVIAEGVEEEEQRNFLAGNMCDEIQGFYYNKPMQAVYVEELLQKKLE